MMSAASIMRVWRSRAAAPLRRGHELAGAALAAVLLAAPAVSTAAGADAGAPAVGSASSAAQFIVHFAPASRPPSGAQIGEATRADLQRLLGRPIIVGEPTRAGDQVIRLTGTATRAEANQLVNRLRMRTDISWAELDPSLQVAVPRSTGSRAAAPLVKRRVRRLIVTFEDEQSLQEARRNGKLGPERDAALSAAAGSLLRVSRATVGGAWLVEGLASMDIAAAEALAARLEASGAVRYAAPDYPAAPALVPNDSYFAAGQQWNLGAPAPPNSFGIGAPQAWNITTGSASVVVAVVDTGIVAHPDLTRILPGYDFISDPFTSNDGDGRDPDPTDPGDWRTAGECSAPFNDPADSSWHGTIVAGIIAANGNNGTGIAGIDWNAQVLPLRALGRCGGSFSDILDAMTWAAGLPVPGVPANPHPARVINMSLTGTGSCLPQIQTQISAVIDAGAFVAVAAGNDAAATANYVPANCLGVNTVAATAPNGMRASYSNFGPEVAISAPGGDVAVYGTSAGIISTWNSGKTVAAAPNYALAEGTSLSPAHVSGVASLMLAVNPALSGAQIKALMAQTATPFPANAGCTPLGICGAGIVNAAGAVQAALSAGGAGSPTQVVEYYYAARDHYFMTAIQSEIDALDANVFPGWQRTGYSFMAYLAPTPGTNPVCRFYIPPPYDSHFYSASPDECAQTLAKYPFFVYESPNVFYIALPDLTTGVCPPGTIPVYRLYNNSMGGAPNHRYTTSLSIKNQMIAQGWVAEGYGPNQVIMCAPQ